MKRLRARCRSCGGSALWLFHEVAEVPVHACRLVESPQAARAAPRGELRLAVCEGCGFVQNEAFDPRRVAYGAGYEDSQACSPRFVRFAEEQADRLAETHRLAGGNVVEIGCGRGDFLALLCMRAGARGVGIDPAADEARLPAEARALVSLRRESYGAAHHALAADLVCCRHTLEHLAEVRAFVASVRDHAATQRAPVFFEVPDVLRVLREGAFWDLYYEHCAYFAPGSLARLFRRVGFDPLRLARGFDGQYLLLDARPGRGEGAPGPEREETPEALVEAVRDFEGRVGEALAGWRARLAALRGRGRRVVLWGAGSKAVGFLQALRDASLVDAVVDINPARQGSWLAGTAQPIVAPEALREAPPDLVVVMNPVYREEIDGMLRALGLESAVESL